MITAAFSASRGAVWNLGIEGESAPIGVTEQHPFRSADRHDWVPAGKLRRGERVLVAGGAAITSWERAGDDAVYNIEVMGDHCYRVGEQGILVHNASGPKAHIEHTAKEPDDETECGRKGINKANVDFYFENKASGQRYLQVAAGTNVLPSRLALDIDPKKGYTAVLVHPTESYTEMAWFKSRKFDQVDILSPYNEPKLGVAPDPNYRWVFDNPRHVLRKGGTLRVIGAREDHEIIKFIRDPEAKNLEWILSLGYELVTTMPKEGGLSKLGEAVTDRDVLYLPSETKNPDLVARAIKRFGKDAAENDEITVTRIPVPGMFTHRGGDTQIIFRWKG